MNQPATFVKLTSSVSRSLPASSTPRPEPMTPAEHLAFLARVLRRDLETLTQLHADGLVSYAEIELVQAGLDSVAALRGLADRNHV